MSTERWEDTLRLAVQPTPPADGAHHSLPETKRHLWLGAIGAIEWWLRLGGPTMDPTGDVLYTNVLGVLGRKRKGDASKIRAVALASAKHDRFTYFYGSLAEAWRNAKRIESLP